MKINKPLILIVILMLLSSVVLQMKMVMLSQLSSQSLNDNTLLGINYSINKTDIISTILILLPALSRIMTFM